MNEIPLSPPSMFWGEDAPYFAYDKERPTYYTESLSYYLMSIFADLSYNGFKFYIETKTPSEQQASIDSFVAEFGGWLSDCEQKVSAWLLEEEESRGLPVLLLPPQISLPLAGSILLFKPALVALAVDSVSSIIRVAQTAMANRRQAQVVRLLDKAFFKDSFWGLKTESIPLLMLEALQGITQKGEEKGIAALLYDALTAYIDMPESSDKEGVNIPIMLKKILDNAAIKLLSHVVVSSGGNIEETEFTLAGTDER